MVRECLFFHVQIDLQWMVLNCDPTRPERETCNELPVINQSYPTFSNLILRSVHKNIYFSVERKERAGKTNL